MSHFTIRAEQTGDYSAILLLTYEAFLTLDYPGRSRMDEHFLVSLLRGSDSVISGLSFVAELGGDIVGHILYTWSEIHLPDGSALPAITFGPLSVAPRHHRQGIGRALVEHSMAEARKMGFGAVLITGVPDYYPRLGFRRAREYGLTLEDGTAADSFMAYELLPDYLPHGGEAAFLAPELELCETDDDGYQRFHTQFMRDYFPAQLALRPFWEADIPLMERWLAEPHIAKWYLHPGHWMHELRNRHGEFAFLSHFIAEFEGTPIGFCQYYDCFFAQEHEVWNDEWRIGERQGEVFSIDYLLGEPAYLRRGLGREIVRLLTEKVRSRGAARIIVQPEPENSASRQVLEANGYIYNGEDFVKELGGREE